MTSKTAKASVTTQVVEAVTSLFTPKPQTVSLTGPMMTTTHKMTALIRKGYIPESMEVFPGTGQMFVMLVLGNPEPAFLVAAESDLAEAAEIEEAQRVRAIDEAAARLVAEREKAAKRAAIQAELDEQHKALEALQAKLRAAEAAA